MRTKETAHEIVKVLNYKGEIKSFPQLNEYDKGLVAGSEKNSNIGKKSQKLIYEVNESKNKIYKLTHPLTGVYMRHGWNCEDIFNKINKDLKNKIKW